MNILLNQSNFTNTIENQDNKAVETFEVASPLLCSGSQ